MESARKWYNVTISRKNWMKKARGNSKLLFCIVSMWHKTTSDTLVLWRQKPKTLKKWQNLELHFLTSRQKSCVQCNARKIRCNNFTEKLDGKSARKFKIIYIINECNILTCTVSIWQKTSLDIPVPWGLKRNNKKDAYLFSRRSFKWYFVGKL